MIDKDIVNIIDEIRNESELKPENEKQLYHKNCGETVMEALKIKYELNIDDNAIKMLAPYGWAPKRKNMWSVCKRSGCDRHYVYRR